MTLILAVATPQAVHMSSDFRLAVEGPDGRGVVFTNDALGAKQVDHQAYEWHMKVAFTGLAQLGHLKLRDVIAGAIDAGTPMDPPDEVEARILRAVNRALSHPLVYGLRDIERRLTILIARKKPGTAPELVLLSNWERLNDVPLDRPLRVLEPTRKCTA
jgi:hypothetical protein